MTPEQAYKKADEEGPSDETRKIACRAPEYAYRYARFVDKCPRDDTREAASRDLLYEYWYASGIDKRLNLEILTYAAHGYGHLNEETVEQYFLHKEKGKLEEFLVYLNMKLQNGEEI